MSTNEEKITVPKELISKWESLREHGDAVKIARLMDNGTAPYRISNVFTTRRGTQAEITAINNFYIIVKKQRIDFTRRKQKEFNK